MTNEQINAAIAEACGWKTPSRKTVLNEKGYFVTQHAQQPPDYCNDLNAMHEAEKSLAYKQFEDYLMELLDFIDEPILATARQRAEAFLRTLGKWEEVQG
jgi:predicted GTPase